jgi:cytoskeletal protein CcmA (bactofilin family)
LGGIRVFKREDSEWSRFSRALSGQPKTEAEEAPAKEEEAPEPAQTPVAREVAPPPPSPTPPPAPPRASTPAFSRPQNATPPQQEAEEVETVIGNKASFEGTLQCESSLRVKGKVQGEISCTKTLVIEETAEVDAKITVANAFVAGKLDGSIVCEGRLEIVATGRVSGELTAGVLIIQEGAFFEGQLKMKDRSTEGKSAADPASSKRYGVPASEPVVS